MAVLPPLTSLAQGDDATPPATARVAAAGDPDGAQRIAAFSPSGEGARASRSAPWQPADDRSVPTTSTSTTSTTSTTAPPPPTTAKPKPAPTTTAKPAPTTTTTAKPKPPPPTTTTTAAPPPPANYQEGGASFHDYADASTCAHRSLPFGTVLTVTNLANGKKATCRVNDRGPYVDGRIIDLSRTTFGQLAPVSAGVIRVSIEW